MNTTTSNNHPSTFEEALKELETIVQTLEEGEVSLEKSLELFKRGISLTEFCNKKLTEAQGIVNILSRNSTGDLQETTFDIMNTHSD
ncbi:MAG: exodeoxyribonuclease VII small subunit [Caldicoprobacterales bacterium]|jgi:exodeoxyribonuclease VII small subunit|nr:exodeoxyribonuclease VII small subunit [Clostridiales bacterium]